MYSRASFTSSVVSSLSCRNERKVCVLAAKFFALSRLIILKSLRLLSVDGKRFCVTPLKRSCIFRGASHAPHNCDSSTRHHLPYDRSSKTSWQLAQTLPIA